MYAIEVSHEFSAAHALAIAGTTEPLHGHNFHVTVRLEGETLDHDGLLCDFHTVHDLLHSICEPFDNADLNHTPPFDRVNPSAEHIARHIGDALTDMLAGELAHTVHVAEVRVTEAPRCVAIYRPGR